MSARQEPTAAPNDNKPGLWEEIPGKCNGKRLGGNGLCRQPEGWGVIGVGTGRCKRHGGATKTHRKTAEKKAAEKAVETYGLPREIAPHDALLEEIHRTAGHVSWLELRVRIIEEAELKDNRFMLSMYDQERRHLIDVCRVAIGAGIAERQVRIAEQTGALIAQVITGLLEDLGVADRPDVPALVRKRLMALDGGKVA